MKIHLSFLVFLTFVMGIFEPGYGRETGVPWWNAEWKYRTRVDIDGKTESAHPNHVLVRLNEWTPGPFSLESDAASIRFVWHYGSSGVITLKLDHWVYDDRITHGAWFSCCSTEYTQYHTPAATYYTTIRPNGIRYRGSYDRSYFVYGDFSRDPVIRYFDNSSGSISDAQIPGRTRIPEDAHGNPSILIDHEGYIYVFYGCHGHPAQMRRSLDPEDITGWSDEVRIGLGITYPQPFMLDDETIVLSYRKWEDIMTSGWGYTTSRDRGTTWDDNRMIVSQDTILIYGLSETGGESPLSSWHLAYNTFDYRSNLYSDIYYLVSRDGLRSFEKADGTRIRTPPFTPGQTELVYDSGELSSHVNDFALDKEGRPCILFNTGPWNQSGDPAPGTWMFARHDGTAWDIDPIAPCDHLFDRGCILIDDYPLVRAFLPVAEDGHNGGEIIEYASIDGGSTWDVIKAVTSGSVFSHNYVVRIRDAAPGFRIFWSYGSSEPRGDQWCPDYSEVMMYGDRGIIGTAEDGRAMACVRLEAFDSPGDLYMYYGNAGAENTSCLETALFHSYAGGGPGNGLLVEWMMDEGSGSYITDSSGNARDIVAELPEGGYVPGGSCVERRYDTVGPGYHLDLTEFDHLVLDELACLSGGDTFSVEVWFKSPRPDEGIKPLIVQGENSPGSGSFALGLDNGRVFFRGLPGAQGEGLYETQTIAPEAWHHLVGVCDGASASVYLDGIKSTTRRDAGDLRISGGPVWVGSGDGLFFSGGIDAVRIYERILSGIDVLRHFKKQAENILEGSTTITESLDERIARLDTRIVAVTPNPFNGSTRIDYSLARGGKVDVSIYDVAGRLIRRLRHGLLLTAGEYQATWDGRGGDGRAVASGIYFCRISLSGSSNSAKIVLLR